jgi:hypothetical protein
MGYRVGIILLVVGSIGAITSMIFQSSWGGFKGRTRAEAVGRDTLTIVERSPSSPVAAFAFRVYGQT